MKRITSLLSVVAPRAAEAARTFRAGGSVIRFGRYAEAPKLNRMQEFFIEWNAERLSTSAAESRARYIASCQRLPGGHGGVDYRHFAVLAHDVFEVFHGDSQAEVFETYRFHGALHFLRFLTYEEAMLVGDPIVQELALRRDVVILDYGCGLAQGSIALAERLRERGVHVTLALADIPTVMTPFLRWAVTRLGLTAEFITCDAQQPYPVLPSCDVCIATEVFEHIHEPLRAFENVDTALRPGGYLVADVDDHVAEFFHVSPVLAELRGRLEARGYAKLGDTIYRKAEARL
jgi:SAM-dependent methyltransferase